jgi:aspartate/methionine/tyrosine aminotransferase
VTAPRDSRAAPAALPRSGIRELMELAAVQPDAVHLEIGEPDFPTPEHILEAADRAGRSGYTKYTRNAGLLSLRESACEKLWARNAIATTPERVVVTPGAVAAIFATLMVLLPPGDQVLVPDPGWPNYRMMAAALGADAVPYPLDASLGFEPDVEALARLAAAPGARVLVVNSPANPTGAVWPRTTHEQVLAVAAEHRLHVVSDEVYDEIVFDAEHLSPASIDGEDRVVSVFSVSKTYAMTGWRIGYLDAPAHLAPAIANAQEAFASCANTVAQKAAEAALRGPQDEVREMRAAYRRRRDLSVELLRRHRLLVNEPRGAFYILADVSRATSDSYAFARRLLFEHGVAVAPGEAFGGAGAGLVRISLASADAGLRAGIAAIAASVPPDHCADSG